MAASMISVYLAGLSQAVTLSPSTLTGTQLEQSQYQSEPASSSCPSGASCSLNLFLSRLLSGIDGNQELDLYDYMPQEELIQDVLSVVKAQIQNGEDVEPEIA